MRDNILKILREHPTLAITFCYIFVTVVGLIYSYYFYSEFGVNYVKFSDVSDFLLASIVEPISLLILVGLIAFIVLFTFLEFSLRKKFEFYGRLYSKKISQFLDPLLFTVSIILVIVFYIRAVAIEESEEVKQRVSDKYLVAFTGVEEFSEPVLLALLGNTHQFSFLYQHDLDRVLVVPIDSILLMEKQENEPEDSNNK